MTSKSGLVGLVFVLGLSAGLVAQNVTAPDAPNGGDGSDVLAADNTGGSAQAYFHFTPTGDDTTYTVVIKDKDGKVVTTVFCEGESIPITVPSGGKAYIHDVDPASPPDTDPVKGNATLT